MQKEFEKELNHVLKGYNKEVLHHLASHMASSTYTGLSIKAALHQLIAEGCKITQILAALVRCEWKLLKMNLPMAEKLDEQRQARYLRGMIERFNALQDGLISASEEVWQKKVMEKNHSRVLQETKGAWVKDKQLTLYNLFEEMPIKASVHISKWDQNVLYTKVTAELGRVFSADPEMRYAFIDSPIDGFRIKVMIDTVHGSRLQLKVVKTDASKVSRREQLRIGLESYKSLKLFADDVQICTVKLTEFSLSGFGLIAKEELPFVAGEKLRCQTQIGKVRINHVGEVVWIQPFLEGGRFGMRMTFDKTTLKKLSSEVLNMQRTKIERLSSLGMPRTLHPRS